MVYCFLITIPPPPPPSSVSDIRAYTPFASPDAPDYPVQTPDAVVSQAPDTQDSVHRNRSRRAASDSRRFCTANFPVCVSPAGSPTLSNIPVHTPDFSPGFRGGAFSRRPFLRRSALLIPPFPQAPIILKSIFESIQRRRVGIQSVSVHCRTKSKYTHARRSATRANIFSRSYAVRA